MKTALACFAFLLAALAFLACLAVALDEYGLAAEMPPVLRANGGITPVGLLVLLIAVPLFPLGLWAGLSLIGNGNDRRP